MLRKIALLIVVGIFSLSIASCGHLKRPLKKKHGKKSELHLNTDVNTYAKYIKIMQEVEA